MPSSAPSGRGSSGPARGSAAARSRSPTPPTSPPRSAAVRFWRCASRRRTPATRHRGVSHHAETVLDLALAEIAVPDTADGEGWEEACAGLPLSHMGRGPDEEPDVLPRRVRRGRRRAQDARLMEERRLGPVVGLGTWNTFRDDAALAGAVVAAAFDAGVPLLRHLADVLVGASARRRTRASARRRDRADEDLDAVGRGSAPPARGPARLVRPCRGRAGAQPRRLGAAPALARGRARRPAGSAGSA